jgi:3-oxoacyl-[acyl-carrier-protein] synthase-1
MANYMADYMANNRIIRIIDVALEQIRPSIEKAITKYGPKKIGVCLGSCDNGSEASLKAHREKLATGNFPKEYELRFQGASFPAEFIAAKFGICGPVMTIATACASGASAIVRGAELIRAGFCNAVIAGGADIVSETVLMGFHALEALSDSLTNPFSKNRKGINLGEGAAFFLLDSLPLDETSSPVALLGVGESADAYHMTGPGPDGIGPVKAMKAALINADLEPGHIGYVNLHGTGTQLNDLTEAMAMKAVFGDTMPPASSTKPIMGHTLGVAGTLEAAVCWMVLTERKGLPVHCWDSIQDEGLVFHPFIPGGQTLESPSVCMSNNFAFGGCNVSLILGRR